MMLNIAPKRGCWNFTISIYAMAILHISPMSKPYPTACGCFARKHA